MQSFRSSTIVNVLYVIWNWIIRYIQWFQNSQITYTNLVYEWGTWAGSILWDRDILSKDFKLLGIISFVGSTDWTRSLVEWYCVLKAFEQAIPLNDFLWCFSIQVIQIVKSTVENSLVFYEISVSLWVVYRSFCDPSLFIMAAKRSLVWKHQKATAKCWQIN